MRGMTIGSDPGGGFALPFSLDPSIMLTSNGALTRSARSPGSSRRNDKWKASRGRGDYFGWYALNVLELADQDIALQFGHQDGGELVRKLYGHPDAQAPASASARRSDKRRPRPFRSLHL